MFCSKCGNQLPDNARFCNKCGTPLPNADHHSASGKVSFANIPAVDLNQIGDSVKNTYRTIVGENSSPSPTLEYKKYTHPYHQLGGWLGFMAYGLLVAVGLLAITALISFYTTIQYARYIGAWIVFASIFEMIAYGFVVLYCIKMFSMILNKNPRFLRFYELTILTTFGISVFAIIVTGFNINSEIIGDMLQSIILFLIWSSYFCKSVRVRTYFGTDDYLRQSIFFKGRKSPEPADKVPYTPQQSHNSNHNASQTQSSHSATDIGTKEFCSKCGAVLASSAAFCSACGERRMAHSATAEVHEEQPDNATVQTIIKNLAPESSPFEPDFSESVLGVVEEQPQ